MTEKPKPLDLWEIEQMLGEIMAKKQFPYCKVSAKARQEILIVLLEEVIPEIKHRIKSACEFYLKFRNDPSVFFALYPQYYDDFEKECGSLTENLEDTTCFNEWLFRLAFKDVLEGEEK